MAWSVSDIPRLDGRRAIVTGANSGLGRQTALELARAGCRVLLAVRDPGRGRAAAAWIAERVPDARLDVGDLDLADLASVRAFARGQEGPLDLLINNAGIMATPPRPTADGFELQLGTNHMGHFALTGLLLERLREAPAPRVVTVSSLAHRIGSVDFDDLNWERSYGPWRAYGRSKLCNLLFARELQTRADASGLNLRSLAAHPGYSSTHLSTTGPGMSGGLTGALNVTAFKAMNAVAATSDAYGARPTLYAATHPEVPGAAFVGPRRLGQTRGPIGPVRRSAAARDDDTARRLFDRSEELTGVTFGLAPARVAA